MANELSTLQATDSFSALAEITQSSAIVGERLRFSKGLYLIGRDSTEPLDVGRQE